MATETVEPLIECDLEHNTTHHNDLGIFDRTPPPLPTPFDHERPHLLADGRSLGAKLQSRLKLVKFGTHTGGRGCLILISIDFTPRSSSGPLRFRDAVVEVQVGPGKGDEVQENKQKIAYDKKRPRVVAWHPRYEEGPVKTTLQKFNISIEGDAVPVGPASLGPNIGYSMSRERVKRRRIHGTLEGELDRVIQWKVEENNSAGDGVPPFCKFAFVVRWEDDTNFYLKMSMRATTVGGMPVIGKNTGAVYFTPDSCLDSTIMDLATHKTLTSAISGGLVGTLQKVFVDPNSSGTVAAADFDLANIDLAELTNAKEMLGK